MTPPPITREAREWLRDCLVRMGGSSEGDTAYQTGVRHTTEALRQKLYSMPSSSADSLDAVRALKEIPLGTYEYENTDKGEAWFSSFGGCVHWNEKIKAAGLCGQRLDILLREQQKPASPHAALIAELRNVSGVYSSITADLLKRAADALEGDK